MFVDMAFSACCVGLTRELYPLASPGVQVQRYNRPCTPSVARPWDKQRVGVLRLGDRRKMISR